MLALSWIAGLSVAIGFCFFFYKLPHIWLSVCIASVLYFGFMFCDIMLFIDSSLDKTESVRLAEVYSEYGNKYSGVGGWHSTFSGSRGADEVIDSKLKGIVMSYVSSKPNTVMHLNDEVKISSFKCKECRLVNLHLLWWL